jgi:hypothetical protein
METIIKQNMTFAEIKKVAKQTVKKLGKRKAFDFAERCSILRQRTSKHKDIHRSYNLAELAIQIRKFCLP